MFVFSRVFKITMLFGNLDPKRNCEKVRQPHIPLKISWKICWPWLYHSRGAMGSSTIHDLLKHGAVWPLWLSLLECCPSAERTRVQVSGLIPGWGLCGGNQSCVSLPLSLLFSPSLPLSERKSIKRMLALKLCSYAIS